MTDEEYAAEVTRYADAMIVELSTTHNAIAICACIEAACNIALKTGKQYSLVTKFREVADLVELESYS